MKRIEAIEAVSAGTAITSFAFARQIQMGEFVGLAGSLQNFFIIAAFSAAIAGASEIIRRVGRRSNPQQK